MKLLKYVLHLYRQSNAWFWTAYIKKRCGSYTGLIRVNYKSQIGGNVHLGNNVHFNGMTISPGGKVTIGDNFHSGTECLIITQNHNYEGTALPYDHTFICKDVVIEDNVWLGSRVIILGGVTIGEGAIIQAGAVVVSNIPPCSIAGGSPAKVFRYRDKDHYDRLKAAKQFS